MTTADLDTATIIEQTPFFSDLWYIRNTGQTGGTPGADLNVLDAWDTATGEGVTVGIVHQGADYGHPDLNDNYSAELSYDFVQNDNDPFPREEEELIYFDDITYLTLFGFPTATGTHLAGIVAAEGDNDVGIIGVAPDASFASLRIQFGLPGIEGGELQAITYQNQEIDIYNSSSFYSSFVELPAELFTGLETNITEGRGGLGNIHVAMTPAGGLEDNINYYPFNNSRFTITVGAVDHNGQYPGYTTPGAALLVSGYSHSDEATLVTTDSRQRFAFTEIFSRDQYLEEYKGSTDAATAQVSGVVALMLEANPNLSWRDVQHILVQTAEKNDPEDADWVQNGAGHDINYKYGFGAVDATEAVETALDWQSVGEEITLTSEAITVDATIPDNDAVGISSSFEITEDISIESIEVIFDSEHPNRGDLEIVLTSPDGTESVLAQSREDDGDNYDNWLFTSVRHWDESSQGEWTLTVTDEAAENEGTWDSWQLNLYGTNSTDNSSDTDNADDDSDDSDAVDGNLDPDGDSDSNSGNDNPNPDNNSDDSAVLETPFYRFQNEAVPGTYLYAGEAEAENIRDNFDNFTEEGVAFQVGIEPDDYLIAIYRFQSEATPGTYLFVGEAERNSINRDFAESFTEEGIAFYVYGADSSSGEPIYRFHNEAVPGTYLFAAEAEAENIRDSFDNFTEEGIAFKI